MKINPNDRIAESIALQTREENPVSFEEQLAAAKASGRRVGPVTTDVRTGLRAVYVYTPEEEAELAAMAARTTTRVKPWRQELDDLKARLETVERK